MIHERHKEWLTGRGLDPVLAEKFGLDTFNLDGANWLRVPYVEAGETINHKWRKTSQREMRMDSGAPLLLWNVDCLKDTKVQSGQTPVIITEGEWDALAAIQCGFPFTVSVPNGAPPSLTTDPENAKRYEWVWRHINDLNRVGNFIIAADDDAAGKYLAADIVPLLGPDRCKFIEYPFPCKDLNEVLQEYGADKVVEIITQAKPYPVKGLFKVDDFPERPEIRSYSVGIPAIADLIEIVPGTLTVVTGYANQGKSSLVNAVVSYALLNHFPVCMASFETEIKPILIDSLRMTMMGCGKHELPNLDTGEVDKVLRERLTIISQMVDENEEMGIDEFLSLCAIAVRQYGVKMIVLDPWNELEHKKQKGESETDYIGRALRLIRNFAKKMNVAFWIVAHPSKPVPGFNSIPGLYEISGSAHWANKPDYGLTYHRPKFGENAAVIMVSKVRMGLPGKRGKVNVTLDFRTNSFREIKDVPAEDRVPVKKTKAKPLPEELDF